MGTGVGDGVGLGVGFVPLPLPVLLFPVLPEPFSEEELLPLDGLSASSSLPEVSFPPSVIAF